jgi:hypothetical protein
MDRAHHTDLCIGTAFAPMLSVTAALMHPDDVISNLQLTPAQKREILASWASDARAVHDMPALRQLDNGAIVRVDDVLRALSALDDDRFSQYRPFPSSLTPQRQHRRPVAWPKVALRRRPSDDDDDPPPCPATIAKPRHGPLSDGETANPVMAMAGPLAEAA